MPTLEAATLAARFGLSPTEQTPRVQVALARLADEAADLRAALEAAQAEADRDPLTGVLNRRGFVRELARAQALVERYEQSFAVLFLDLDGFKALNDQFGHGAGDCALMQAAQALRTQLRLEDHLGRLGGDEFAILLAHADLESAQAKAESLVRHLAQTPCHYEGRNLHLAASIGTAILQRGDRPELALARADEAMYGAKQAAKRRAAIAALGLDAA